MIYQDRQLEAAASAAFGISETVPTIRDIDDGEPFAGPIPATSIVRPRSVA